MDESIIIREATVEDAATVAQLSRRTFFDTFSQQNTPNDMEMFLQSNLSDEKVKDELDDKKNIFLLAYDNDEVAGYAKLSESTAPAGLESLRALEISRLYSVQGKIGKGIGKRLMQEAINLAKEKRKDIIWLGVWEKNERAISFYERWGFEKFSEHTFILGTDEQNDWLMRKLL